MKKLFIGSLIIALFFTVGCQKNSKSEENSNNLEIICQEFSNNQGDNIIHISYPSFVGYFDKSKEKAINELIELDIKKLLASDLYAEEKLFIDFEYEIKYVNEFMISIFYNGFFGINGGQLYQEVIGTTIDIENEKILKLSDIISDFDSLSLMLLEDEFESITEWEGVKGTGSIKRSFGGLHEKILKEALITDTFNFENHYIEWYTDGVNFVVVTLEGRVYNEYSKGFQEIDYIFNQSFVRHIIN